MYFNYENIHFHECKRQRTGYVIGALPPSRAGVDESVDGVGAHELGDGIVIAHIDCWRRGGEQREQHAREPFGGRSDVEIASDLAGQPGGRDVRRKKLGAFLQKIRELPRIVNVGKLKVDSRSGPGPDGTPLTIGATYEATTFVYREISDTAETVKAKK